MSKFCSRQSQAFLALSCVGALMSPAAHAQQTGEQETLGGEEVRYSDVEEPGRRQESPKATRPVRDTPQTVTVLTNTVIEQQNLLTLRDMLSTVPGITFGAAEGGTPPSDQINFRGFPAGTDITQDGVRDSAAYNRSDSFNLEQLEVTNGANSVISGAGSVGGSINIVTKRPKPDTEIIATAGIGTDDYYRGTIDANVRVSDFIALRLNAMGHKNGVPGRDIEESKRWGIAPSVTIGIDSPTRLTLQYFHQEDDNIPQYGVPYYKNAFNDGMLPGVERGDYFGYRNVDTQQINVDQATMIFEHEFSDAVSLRNLARWQDVTQLTIVGPPQGTYCLSGNLLPTGAACPATVPAGYYLISGPRGNYRDSRNQLMFDQLDLRANFNTGPIEHTAVFGGAVSWEKYTLESGNMLRKADRTLAYSPYPLINIANPYEVVAGPAGFTYGSNLYTGPINRVNSAGQNGEVTNYALYLFDTMKLGKFELNGGIRWESNNAWGQTTTAGTAATLTVPQGQPTWNGRTYNKDKFVSYRVGLVYKPIEAVSLYVAYGNSKRPSQTSVNGSCTETAAGTGTCSVKPEGAKNYEIGAKAELFDGGLLLTASAFRNDLDSYRVDSGEVGIPAPQLDGHQRVDGIALSAQGQITPAWSVTANYTYLDGELRQSVSNYCLANPGKGSCTNSTALPDPLKGAELANTPKHSGSLFTTYTLPFGLTLGYGATYQGRFAFTTALAGAAKSDAYWVHNAYLAYQLTPALSAQINVKNLTDKLYFTRIRNGGWATPGEGRAGVLSINYKY
ncbi:MAG: TonB-dependent receptor [Sphingomonadales bacterium]|nr:TonB-dependent receptor [Sphingomonadales bacterium]